MSDDNLLDSREAAKYLGLTYGHVKDLRSDGKGPVYLRDGRGRIAYVKADLDRYIRFTRVHVSGGMR